MDEHILVSIITPCYNSTKTLHETIQSVISQTYPYWEMFIIDDCSTDGSDLIIQEFANKDSRIKYLKTEKSSGSPTLPRNMGIKESQGRFIAFLDSDDVWISTKLEEQVRLFENDKVAIVFSNYEKMSYEGVRNGRYVIAPSEANYRQLLKENTIGCLTAVYDTKKVGKQYFQKIGHEDFVLWLSILKKGYIAKNTNTILARYRVGNHSVSSNKIKALKWTWNIYRNVENLSYVQSIYCFINYAFRAGYKFLK